MSLLDRIRARRGPAPDEEQRYSADTYFNDIYYPSTFQYNGITYPIGLTGTLGGNRAMEITNSLPGYTAAVLNCPPAFAAQDIRAAVVSQMRFTYRYRPWVVSTSRKPEVAPRREFSKPSLNILEIPWPGATTADLVSRMEWHAGLGGAAFVAYRQDPGEPHLQVLRPDWCALVWGSHKEPENPGQALDREFLGTVYWNGGPHGQWGYSPEFLLPDECIHWVPKPDPLAAGAGMSWLAPAVRDVQSDRLAGEHKIHYWENGATPNLVITGLPALSREQFDEAVEMIDERHQGAANAFRTLYLTAGASADVIGNNFSEIDFRAVTAAGETRIASLSHVPASLLGISEGLQGSSLNAGNFAAARRSFADIWVYPTLQDISKSLAPLVKVASNAELWFDATDIPLLHEDAKDQAEINAVLASSIQTLWNAGFEPETVVAAVAPQWSQTLKHTGLAPVQAQPIHGIQNANEVGQLLQPSNDT